MVNFCHDDAKVWNLKVESFQQCQRYFLPLYAHLGQKSPDWQFFGEARISLTDQPGAVPTGPKSGFCSRYGSY